MSKDGNRVGFLSAAPNLIAGDTNEAVDVFIRDRVLGRTVAASVNSAGELANRSSLNAVADETATFIVFQSDATNLVPNDTNRCRDIFLRNLNTGQTELISQGLEGAQGNGDSSDPQISASGRYVLFLSWANNLGSVSDLNRLPDLYLRDREAKETLLVSRHYSATNSSNGYPDQAVLSPDGQRVAFTSSASDIVPNDSNSNPDLFIFSAVDQTNQLLRGAGTALMGGPSFSPDSQSSGVEQSSGLNRAGLVVFGSPTNQLINIPTPNGWAAANVHSSVEGNFLAYNLTSGGISVVFLWDRVANQSTNLTGLPALSTTETSIVRRLSDDGQRVTFLSLATNLATNAVSGTWQLYQHNRGLGRTELISVRASGESFRQPVFSVVASPDGTKLAFQSAEEGLFSNDQNGAVDIFFRDLNSGSFELISARDNNHPGVTAGGASQLIRGEPVMAANRLLFASTAPLIEADVNLEQDLYARDISLGTNRWITAESPEPAATRPWINGPLIRQAMLSADGRTGLFVTAIPGLVESDTNAVDDIFLSDLTTAQITSVRASANVDLGRSHLRGVCANNRLDRLAFLQWPPGAPPNVTNNQNVVLWDRTTDLFKSLTNGLIGSWAMEPPVMDDEGTKIVFATTARWAADSNAVWDVVAYDIQTGQLSLVSERDLTLFPPDGSGSAGDARSFNPVISRNGKVVVFLSDARKMTPDSTNAGTKVFARNLQANKTALVSVPLNGVAQPKAFSASPTLSADGTRVCFSSRDTNLTSLAATTNYFQAYVRDLSLGQTMPVTVNASGSSMSDGQCHFAKLSPNGRWVLFGSSAKDLISNDGNGRKDLFLRDLTAGTTLRIELPHAGPELGAAIYEAAWNWEGDAVVIASSNAGPGDMNQQPDIFLFRLTAGDSDADGLPDDWEIAFFGDLAKDGRADNDGDGATDLQEWMAGTSPISGASVFTVYRLERVGSGEVTVLWRTVPGRRYRIEYKDRLTNPWTALSAEVVAQTDSASFKDNVGGSTMRFYRAVLIAP